MFLAIQIANHSAFRAFQAGVDIVAGKSHLEVVAADGRLDETLFPAVARAPGVRAATPVCEGFVTLPDYPGEYLRIIGVDPFTNSEFQMAALVGSSANPAAWLETPFTLSLPESLAELLKVTPGDHLRAELNGRSIELPVGFVVAETPVAGAARSAAMDIGWCQELFDSSGYLSSVQIILENPDAIDEARAALDPILPPGVSAKTPAGRSEQIGLMLRGFQLNITALSMVSILVGMFLIYNTTSASAVRRRKEIGTLRALGATRGYVQRMFLREALLHGVIGVALGVFGGVLLARALLGAVSETISAHYVVMSIDRAYISPLSLVIAIVYGLAAVFAGAYLPAREAARSDPARALRPAIASGSSRRSHTRLPFVIGAICLLLAVLCALSALGGGPAPLSFVACFLLVIGFALAMPLVSDLFAALTSHLANACGALLPGMAARSFRRSLHRTAVTTGAMMVAIAMMVGVAVMIASFRGTVDRWIDQAMAADLFVGVRANEIVGLKAFTPPEVRAYLGALPGTARVDTYLETPVTLADGGTYALAAISGGTNGTFSFVGGGDGKSMAQFFEPDHVILSEPLASKLELSEGEFLSIPTPGADVSFRVAGVYYDYSDDHGRIIISRPNFDTHWDEPRFNSLAIYLRDGVEPQPVVAALKARFSPGGELAIYTNRGIRERIFEIFDQTFSVTYVLRTIAIVVAVLGIALTLITLVAERTREIGVLRAVGAGRGQVGGAIVGEALLIGAIGSLTGIICGVLLAMLLTWVVNRAFFGWTIQFSVPWKELLMIPLWTLPVAALAGLLPAMRASKLEIARAIRME